MSSCQRLEFLKTPTTHPRLLMLLARWAESRRQQQDACEVKASHRTRLMRRVRSGWGARPLPVPASTPSPAGSIGSRPGALHPGSQPRLVGGHRQHLQIFLELLGHVGSGATSGRQLSGLRLEVPEGAGPRPSDTLRGAGRPGCTAAAPVSQAEGGARSPATSRVRARLEGPWCSDSVEEKMPQGGNASQRTGLRSQ